MKSAQELKIIGAEALMNLNWRDADSVSKGGVDSDESSSIIEPESGDQNGHTDAENHTGPPSEADPD